MSAKLSDVVKDLRLNVGYILLASIGWIASADSFENTIERREQVRQLVAFILLRETFAPLERSNLFDPPKEGMSKVEVEKPISAYTLKVVTPLRIVLPWNPNTSALITVKKVNGNGLAAGEMEGRVDSLTADNPYLPFSSYRICYCFKQTDVNAGSSTYQVRVVRGNVGFEPVEGGDESLGIDSPPYAFAPFGWERLSPFLRQQGWTGTDPAQLSLSDPAVDKVIRDYLVEQNIRQDVGGVSVPISLLPIGLGVIVVMASLSLVGSVVALRQARRERTFEQTGWIMLQFGGQKSERSLSFVASIVLAACAFSAPCVAGAFAIHTLINHPGEGRILYFFLGSSVLGMFLIVEVLIEQYRLQSAGNSATPSFEE